MTIGTSHEYDGLFFHPNEDEQLDLYHIILDSEYQDPLNNNSNIYHIGFIEFDENGKPFLHQEFDAMLLDPVTYLLDGVGSNHQGCIMRKTSKSRKWFDKWVKNPHDLINFLELEFVMQS